MAQLKAGEVERYLQRSDADTFLWLVYGPDRGLVSERANRLAELSKVPLDDPFSSVRLDASTSDGPSLVGEANTVAMFAADRLIRVSSAGNEKAFVDQVKELLNAPPPSTKIILEAGDLKKGSALRSTVETAAKAYAIPCFADNNQMLNRLIEDVFNLSEQTLENDARQYLQAHLGADRGASRQELDKLSLYALGSSTISKEDVVSVIGDAAADDIDSVIDAVLVGNLAAFDESISRYLYGRGDCNVLLFAAIRQLHLIETLRAELDASGRSASAIVLGAKPTVFFARRPIVETALQKWTRTALRAADKRVRDSLLSIRQNGHLASEITQLCLLGLAVQSARRR